MTTTLDPMKAITPALAREIAMAALCGHPSYTHEAIGPDDGDINDMENETGGKLMIRAESTDAVAVYQLPDGSLVMVCDANGPIAIRNVGGGR